MARPGKRDIDIYVGDDYAHTVTLTSDGTTPINITGRTYIAQVRASAADTTATLSFTCTVPTGTDGVVNITASDTLTAALTDGAYVWDLQESASGVVTTILRGSCRVTKDVTRA